MAITQLSKIQIRQGLEQDLPQLSSGEMGWSIDTQKLYIGNGTLADGAPIEGNTEILTEKHLATTPKTITLSDNISSPTETIIVGNQNVTTKIDFTITRGATVKSGTTTVRLINNTVVFDEESISTDTTTGITLSWVLVGSLLVLHYTSTNTGSTATMTYVERLAI